MLNVADELKRLHGLPLPDLHEEYIRLTGDPARSNNRTFLIKRIVWRLQEAEQGGLSERAIRRAAEIARESDLRVRPRPEVHAAYAQGDAERAGGSGRVSVQKRLPATGSVLTRDYRGRRLSVKILDGGFEFENQVYTSLTAVAKAATGADWNGRLFFGLTSRRTRP